MSKIRFIFSIIIILYIIFVFPLALLDYLDLFIFFMISFALFIGFFTISRREKTKLVQISKIYLDELDPKRYIEEYQKIIDKSVLANNNKYLSNITIALASLSLGKVSEAKKILNTLIEDEPEFSLLVRFWYYKAWIYYFEETSETERISALIHQSKLLIDNCPIKYRQQLLSNYNQIIARFYVLTNIHLNLAETEFNKVFKGRFPKFNVVMNIYYLGVIAYKQNSYERAVEYFKSVVKNGNKLNVVNKAKEYLELIEARI